MSLSNHRPNPTTTPRQSATGPAVLFTIGIIVAASTSCRGGATSESAHTEAVPSSKPEMDPLDVLPSHPGELQIRNAWRVSASGVDLVNGRYEWAATSQTVTLSCSFPPRDAPDCDKSVPLRFRLGGVPACGSSKDADGTGPLVAWRSCTLQIDEAGAQIPKRFERLKAAATDAVPWTEQIFASTNATADVAAIMKNRANGLLDATRRGNVMRNLDISHQLDVRR